MRGARQREGNERRRDRKQARHAEERKRRKLIAGERKNAGIKPKVKVKVK
jgi:hypothetical protein